MNLCQNMLYDIKDLYVHFCDKYKEHYYSDAFNKIINQVSSSRNFIYLLKKSEKENLLITVSDCFYIGHSIKSVFISKTDSLCLASLYVLYSWDTKINKRFENTDATISVKMFLNILEKYISLNGSLKTINETYNWANRVFTSKETHYKSILNISFIIFKNVHYLKKPYSQVEFCLLCLFLTVERFRGNVQVLDYIQDMLLNEFFRHYDYFKLGSLPRVNGIFTDRFDEYSEKLNLDFLTNNDIESRKLLTTNICNSPFYFTTIYKSYEIRPSIDFGTLKRFLEDFLFKGISNKF